MIKSHFFGKKPASTHTKHIHLYVGCFIFSRKRRAHADLIPESFFALSAPRRCMRSAAVVERHTPPRTMLGQWLGGSFGPAVLHKGLTFDRPLITGKNHTEIHR